MIIPVITSGGVSTDASELTLRDTTGAYHVSDNPGGYGAPNAIEPVLVGLRIRYWADDDPYANKVIDTPATIAAMLTAGGHPFTYLDLGLSAGEFSSGVHHIKYYPFEPSESTATVEAESKLVTVTAGTTPNSINEGYKAVVFLDGDGAIVGKVYLIDWAETQTLTTLYLTEAWAGDDTVGLYMHLATEADLKILVTALAEACLTNRIAQLANYHECDPTEVDLLSDLITWKFAADVKFQCSDYSGAHNLIVSVNTECAGCETLTSCQTCSS